MKPATILMGGLVSQALAYPGMGRVMAEIQARDDLGLERRGDILTGLLGGVLTAVGSTIKSILEGGSAIADGSTYTAPGELGSTACSKDPLCVWSYIVKDMSSTFAGPDGCTDLARGAIRQGFHDAATWDQNSAYGGADGSLLLSDELGRGENAGLGPIADQTKAWYGAYRAHNVSMADLIQTGALVGTVSCPGGPRIRAFAGRADDARAGPPGRLPLFWQDAPTLVALFAAKTFTARDLVALLGAHTSAKQAFVDPARAGSPLDSDPGVWDTRYYAETLAADNTTTMVLPSDRNVATYAQTQGVWNSFAGGAGSATWGPAYASAYFRMSMLGVKNMNQLTDITRVLPLPR
ncbi:peroxidase manganese-dependent 1 [Xylariomycetidae sp. FL0641]|nr:peroxidase manganese-dependent 1 [Xylariomycetidae sp. FL0641]